MNKAIIIGRLVRDPEMRTTSSGINSTTFDFDSCSAYYFGVDLKFTSLITSCYDSTKK